MKRLSQVPGPPFSSHALDFLPVQQRSPWILWKSHGKPRAPEKASLHSFSIAGSESPIHVARVSDKLP